jgi:hypothetical protein
MEQAPGPRTSPVEPERPSRWQVIEQRLVENWTGILGTVVVVTGITFIGAYAGLHVAPIYRCGMLVLAAALFSGSAMYLRRFPTWEPLAQWLRSAGAAVFLFAMFASSAVPGLRWITSLPAALGVLLLGVSANLLVAATAEGQGFASLHVVLSLIPLMLVPQSAVALSIGTIVATVGLVLAFRPRWDLHALITLTAYLVYHVSWHVRAFGGTPSDALRLLGTGSAVLVSSAGLVTHYRRAASPTTFKALPLLVHLACWGIVGAGLVLHLGDTPWRATVLLVAACMAFLLGRRASSLGVRWVHTADALTAQLLAMAGVVLFQPFVFHWLFVPVLLFLETALFLRIVIDEDEPLLTQVGSTLMHMSAFALAVGGLLAIESSHAHRLTIVVQLLGCAGFAAAIFQYFLKRRFGEEFDSLKLVFLGISAGLFVVVALANLFDSTWMETAAVGGIGGLLLAARLGRSMGLGVAIWLTLLVTCLLSWAQLLSDHSVPAAHQVLYRLGPTGLSTALVLAFPPAGPVERFVRSWAIYLSAAVLGVAAFSLLQPVSPLIPGIVWLGLSLVALEVANRLTEPDWVQPVLLSAYGYLVAFGVAYVLVVMQTETYLGPVRVRQLIELYAVGVLAFWWQYRPRGALGEQRVWRALHPLTLELLLTFAAIATVMETAPPWRPLLWSAYALACVALAGTGKFDARLRFYSLVFFWGSTFDLVMVTSTFATPAPRWYEHPGFTGGLAIAAQVVYLATCSERLTLSELLFPHPLERLARWSRAIAPRQALWLYYPFFIDGAVFLYWRFAAGVLTLLWAAEAFIVFVLSLVLRENQFRYMALAALAACLGRLLVFDMAQANLAVRGGIFIGVGGLMLGMNSLYNRYKGRFA